MSEVNPAAEPVPIASKTFALLGSLMMSEKSILSAGEIFEGMPVEVVESIATQVRNWYLEGDEKSRWMSVWLAQYELTYHIRKCSSEPELYEITDQGEEAYFNWLAAE